MMTLQRKTNDKGLTLVELLVAVVIIGVLASIGVPIFISQREKAQSVSNYATVGVIGQTLLTIMSTGGTASVNGNFLIALGDNGTQVMVPVNDTAVEVNGEPLDALGTSFDGTTTFLIYKEDSASVGGYVYMTETSGAPVGGIRPRSDGGGGAGSGGGGPGGGGPVAPAYSYISMPSYDNDWLTVVDTNSLDIVGDFDIRLNSSMPDWTPATDRWRVEKSGTPNASYALIITSAGAIQLAWNETGRAAGWKNATSTVPVGALDGTATWIRAALDVDNGSGGYTVTFYTSADGLAWTPLGDPVTAAGVTSIHAGTTDFYVDGGGNVYQLELHNGIDGPTVLGIDASTIPSGSTTAFVATTGQTVWMMGGSVPAV